MAEFQTTDRKLVEELLEKGFRVKAMTGQGKKKVYTFSAEESVVNKNLGVAKDIKK